MQRQLDGVVHKLIYLMTYLTTNACTHTHTHTYTHTHAHTHTVKGGSQLILPHQNYAETTMIASIQIVRVNNICKNGQVPSHS